MPLLERLSRTRLALLEVDASAAATPSTGAGGGARESGLEETPPPPLSLTRTAELATLPESVLDLLPLDARRLYAFSSRRLKSLQNESAAGCRS